ncbi:MAG: hypothetical protein K2X87_06130 [Gemmataceae bacterium]|nr:hypothetical protein [Gemmataceae bacterium]
MDATTRDSLLVAVGAVGMVWYFLCLLGLGFRPPGPSPSPFQQFQGLSVTTISTTLATFVGLFLGIQVAKSDTDRTIDRLNEAQESLNRLQAVSAADAAGKAGPAELRAPAAPLSAAKKEVDEAARVAAANRAGYPIRWYHYAAFGLYLTSLGLGLFFWGRPPAGAEPDPAVVGLGRSTLGVLVGGLSALLTLAPAN